MLTITICMLIWAVIAALLACAYRLVVGPKQSTVQESKMPPWLVLSADNGVFDGKIPMLININNIVAVTMATDSDRANVWTVEDDENPWRLAAPFQDVVNALLQVSQGEKKS